MILSVECHENRVSPAGARIPSCTAGACRAYVYSYAFLLSAVRGFLFDCPAYFYFCDGLSMSFLGIHPSLLDVLDLFGADAVPCGSDVPRCSHPRRSDALVLGVKCIRPEDACRPSTCDALVRSILRELLMFASHVRALLHLDSLSDNESFRVLPLKTWRYPRDYIRQRKESAYASFALRSSDICSSYTKTWCNYNTKLHGWVAK